MGWGLQNIEKISKKINKGQNMMSREIQTQKKREHWGAKI